MTSSIQMGSRKTVSTEISEEVKDAFMAWGQRHGFQSYREALAALILLAIREDLEPKAGPTGDEDGGHPEDIGPATTHDTTPRKEGT